MPVPSKRREYLKELRRFIEENSILAYLEDAHDLFDLVCTAIHVLEQHRYLERSFTGPSTYFSVSDTRILETVKRMGPPEFRESFRMDREELQRLFHLIKDHDIYHNAKGRPQRQPIIQLSVFLYRLGSGARIGDVQRAFGGLPRGSIDLYFKRTLVPIMDLFQRVVVWPDSARRREIEAYLADNHQLPGCVGFIDGSHIILHKTPSFTIEKNATFWSRKKRYGLLVLAVCDHQKRFTYVQTGHYSAATDFRAQHTSPLVQRPENLFDAEQYVLGDSGFYCTNEVIAMFRRKANASLSAEETEFNDHVAHIRVIIEHAFGILKQRWMMLNDMHILLKDQFDLSFAYAIIRAAVVLHNLFVDTSARYWSEAAYRAARRAADDLQNELEAAEVIDQPASNESRQARRKRLSQSIHWILESQPRRKRRRTGVREGL